MAIADGARGIRVVERRDLTEVILRFVLRVAKRTVFFSGTKRVFLYRLGLTGTCIYKYFKNIYK